MSEFTDRETQPAGRSIRVMAFGDTAADIELDALDEARPFFGDGLILRVVPDYLAMTVLKDGMFTEQAAGRKYQASVTVQVTEPEQEA